MTTTGTPAPAAFAESMSASKASSPATYRAAVLLAAFGVLASMRFMALDFIEGGLPEVQHYILYQAGTLSINYIDFGPLRRGLAGTIAQLLSPDLTLATIYFHVLSAVCLATSAAWLFKCSAAERRAALAIVFMVLMLRWGDDRGRIDMAIAFGLCCATIAWDRGRPGLAAAIVGLGLFAHESSLVFGLPLLAALLQRSGGLKRLSKPQRAAMVAGIGIALTMYVVVGALPHADVRTIVDTVRGRLPPHDYVEWALYFALSGMRGVATSVCQNRTDPSYWMHPVGGLALIGLTTLALVPRRQWGNAALAALPGFVFLSVVANDIGRWAMFACFNVWLLAVSNRAARNDDTPIRTLARVGRPALALLLVPLILWRASDVLRVYSPSPPFERLVIKLGGPITPTVDQALERCDPRWREVLDQPGAKR